MQKKFSALVLLAALLISCRPFSGVMNSSIESQKNTNANVNGVISSPVGQNQASKWSILEWSLENPSYSGNPFELEARAVFTHEGSGERRVTEMFYNGGNTWKFRFLPTQEGKWNYSTESNDSDLSGQTGSIAVGPAEHGQTGLFYAQGDKFVWEGKGAIIPQFIMGTEPPKMHQSPESSDYIVDTFIKDYKFNGLHIPVFCGWFNIETITCHGVNGSSNPDLRTVEAVEQLMFKARAAGGLIHLWMWGDSQFSRNPQNFSGLNVTADRRLQRYLAARYGAIPNWSMGYGYDLHEWVTDPELRNWHSYMKSKMGWNHLFGARGHHMHRLHQITEHMDYSSYEDFRPTYGLYVEAFSKRPGKPVFFEDRFRVNQGPSYVYKDYTYDETRKGLWHSAMAGGAANIWGNVQENWIGHSRPYPAETADQFRTYNQFFEGRFFEDMKTCNDLTGGVGGANYPVIGTKNEMKAVEEAARWVRNNFPQYFKEEWLQPQHGAYARGQAYHMMTEVINALRFNGWDASRAVAGAGRPPSDPYRWGSDAVVIGPRKIIYDVYVSWPHPAHPQAAEHGFAEVSDYTADLIPVGGGPLGAPATGVCLKSEGSARYVFYVENSDKIRMNLSGMDGRQRAVAVDTRRAYEEIDLGFIDPQDLTWTAPYSSDWAIAVGEFGRVTARSLLRGQGPASFGAGAKTSKITPVGEPRYSEEYAAIRHIDAIQWEKDASGADHNYVIGRVNGSAAEYVMELGGEHRYLHLTAKADKPGPVLYRIYVDGEPAGFVSIDANNNINQTKSVDIGEFEFGPHYVAVEMVNDFSNGSGEDHDRNMFLDVLQVLTTGTPGPAKVSKSKGEGPLKFGTGLKDASVTKLGDIRWSEFYYGFDGVNEIVWSDTPNGESHNYLVCNSYCVVEYKMELGGEHRKMGILAKADVPGPVLVNVYINNVKVGSVSFTNGDNNNQMVMLDIGSIPLGVHYVALEFANDMWDGTGKPDGDRNFYLDAVWVQP